MLARRKEAIKKARAAKVRKPKTPKVKKDAGDAKKPVEKKTTEKK